MISGTLLPLTLTLTCLYLYEPAKQCCWLHVCPKFIYFYLIYIYIRIVFDVLILNIIFLKIKKYIIMVTDDHKKGSTLEN